MHIAPFLTFIGVVAAVQCKIRGPGTAQARVCPARNCDPSGPIISTAGSLPSRNIICIWDNGATVPGGGGSNKYGKYFFMIYSGR